MKKFHVPIFASQYSNWVLTMKDQFKGHAFLISATANRGDDHTIST